MTTFQPAGNAKSYAYLLTSGTASVKGFSAEDPDVVHAQHAETLGKSRAKPILIVGKYGLVPGTEANFARTLANTRNCERSLTGVTMADATFALHNSGVLDGKSLHAVFGNAVPNLSEIQKLTFVSADPNAFRGVRARGTTAFFSFGLAIANAALATGIAGLPAYNGRNVTITGAAFTGANPSGTRQIAFDGAVDVPQVEAVSGAVDAFIVVGGNSGNYSANGSSPFVLPITEGALQTNLRNLGGQFAGVVVKGASAGGSIPTISSGGTVIASAPGSADGSPGNVFDGNRATYWTIPAGQTPVWIGYDRGVGKAVVAKSYQVIGYQDDNPNNPGSWTFEGSNDNATWTILDTKTAQPSSASNLASPAIQLTNAIAFRYYRLNISAASGGGGFGPVVGELKIFDGTVIPASANFKFYYPLDAAPPAPTATGTGATIARRPAGVSPDVIATTIQQATGADASFAYNVVTESGDGDWVDFDLDSPAGFHLAVSVIHAQGVGATLGLTVETADADGGGAPVAASIVTLHTFALFGARAYDIVASKMPVKRLVRVRRTVTGAGEFIFALALAPRVA